MREKSLINGSPYFQEVVQVRYWTSNKSSKHIFFKRLFRRYQKIIDTTFAAIIIGAMFLTGVWFFLVQLAGY
jgi:triphosphoribosyl-dephospho-CoA synthetase